MKRIYLDYASTTPLDRMVAKAMRPFLSKQFGNPSSIHAEGVSAKKAVDEARIKVARALEVRADEIVFTSGGTESNNLAILGLISSSFRGLTSTNPAEVKPPQKHKLHIVTTNIEHSSVLEPLRELERRGMAEVTYVPVEPNGIVKAEKVIAAIRPNTALVSVSYANNEIGTVQPIRKIAQLLLSIHNSKFIIHNSIHEKRYPVFHTDACQAPLYLNCLVNSLGVDLMTLDGHKMYGPKGVGALYARRDTALTPILIGGGQERGLRSTTENVHGIVGFAEALTIAVAMREKESHRLYKLRNLLYSDILPISKIAQTKYTTGHGKNNRIAGTVILNGDMEERLPNNLNISLPGADTEMLVLKLDAAGIACSTKSSCMRDERSSYVVSALGGGNARAESSIRFTLGRFTTAKEIEYVAETLCKLLSEK